MTKRIIAIVFIFICASVAWAILGGTIFSRTYDSGLVSRDKVASTWGSEHYQSPPSASFTTQVQKKEESLENGKKVVTFFTEPLVTELPLESSRIRVDLDLQHRQKGLLWYSTYKVAFTGAYGFRNTSDKEQIVNFTLPFPTTQAIFDNLVFTVDGIPIAISNNNQGANAAFKLAAGKTTNLGVSYSSQGLNRWHYNFGKGEVAQVRDFDLRMTTNFKDIDVSREHAFTLR